MPLEPGSVFAAARKLETAAFRGEQSTGPDGHKTVLSFLTTAVLYGRTEARVPSEEGEALIKALLSPLVGDVEIERPPVGKRNRYDASSGVQKLRRSMNCNWREVPAPVAPSLAVTKMRPKVEVEMLATGSPYCARLKRLKASKRKSMLAFS